MKAYAYHVSRNESLIQKLVEVLNSIIFVYCYVKLNSKGRGHSALENEEVLLVDVCLFVRLILETTLKQAMLL